MIASEMVKYIDRDATYKVKDLTFRVTIVDVRERFGQLDANIHPEAGDGYMWVSMESIKLI